MSNEFYWIAVAVVTIISSARLTRLATFDDFPPTKWLRDKFADLTDGSQWQLLAFCAYCASFWITAAVVGLGLAAGVYTGTPDSGIGFSAWWIVNGILAASYLAAVFMVNDGDNDEPDVVVNAEHPMFPSIESADLVDEDEN